MHTIKWILEGLRLLVVTILVLPLIIIAKLW